MGCVDVGGVWASLVAIMQCVLQLIPITSLCIVLITKCFRAIFVWNCLIFIAYIRQNVFFSVMAESKMAAIELNHQASIINSNLDPKNMFLELLKINSVETYIIYFLNILFKVIGILHYYISICPYLSNQMKRHFG